MNVWMFTALDTWFFRDSLPFNQGEQGTVYPDSLFPPSIYTLQGAIRTALAQGQGWTKRNGLWPTKLGDTHHLGELRLFGPYLNWNGKYLFPAPAYLFGKKLVRPEEKTRSSAITRWELTRLVPGEMMETDLGQVVLPRPARPILGGKALQNVWLTYEGLARALTGGVPSDEEISLSEGMWQEEFRIGISRDSDTRTARDEQMYTAMHIRPGRELKLAVIVDGLPDEWHRKVSKTIPLGGEGRIAAVEISPLMDAKKILPPAPELKSRWGKIRFTISLITPGSYDDVHEVVRQGPPGVPGTCITACLPKLQQAGGWDLANNEPRPLRPVVPAGSTWFYETEEDDLDRLMELHGRVNSPYGDGQMVVGIWEEEKQ